jgi:hypothetical protein
MTDLPGYARAQAQWEAMEPPEGPSECPDCNGYGHAPAPGDPFGDHDTCSVCKGYGLLTASGEPFDPHKAARDACDYADMQRDERLTNPPDAGDFE